MTPVTDAPTNELGTPGGIWPAYGAYGGGIGITPASYILDGLEQNADLKFPSSSLIYDRMRKEDKLGAAYAAMVTPILGTPARLVGTDVSKEVLRFVELELGLEQLGAGKARRRRQGIVFGEHLRQALLMLAHGFMCFEQVYEVAPATPDYVDQFPDTKGRLYAHLRKLGPRMARSIAEIRVARDGGLDGITQSVPDPRITSGGLPGLVFIPADRLVWYVHNKEGSDWTGQSVLRPAYKHWLIKDALMRLDAQIVERNGMGIPVVNYDPAVPGAQAQALALAKSVRAGAEAGAALPNGQTLSLIGVAGSTVDPIPRIEYHDRSAAESMLAHFLTLGHDNGARALGDTFVEFFIDSLKAPVGVVEDTFTEHVIRDLVEHNYGPDEPYPSLKFDDLASDAAPTSEALKLLSDAGLIVADDTLKKWTRTRYGLPKPDHESDNPRNNIPADVTPGPDDVVVDVVPAPPTPAPGVTVPSPADGPPPFVKASAGDYLSRLTALNAAVLALHQGHPS